MSTQPTSQLKLKIRRLVPPTLGGIFLAVAFVFVLRGQEQNYVRTPSPSARLTTRATTAPTDYSGRRAYAQPVVQSGAPQWQDAEAKWAAFAKEHMERMRRLDRNFDREWFEIKHPLISKYLPHDRVFTDKYLTFVLSDSGRITEIGTAPATPTSYKAAPDFAIRNFSDFLKFCHIPVTDSATAVEIVRLSLIVDGGHGFPSAYEDARAWRFSASRREATWTVKVEYIGDPKASIGLPPTWDIKVDKQTLVLQAFVQN